jgi:hypothetical protein
MASKSSPMINKVDRAIESHVKPTYMFLVTGIYIVYILIFLGISYVAPQHIRFISNLIHILLAIILIIKFNPFRSNNVIAPSDGALIFGAAIFILINVGITEFAISFFDSVKNLFNIDMSSIS